MASCADHPTAPCRGTCARTCYSARRSVTGRIGPSSRGRSGSNQSAAKAIAASPLPPRRVRDPKKEPTAPRADTPRHAGLARLHSLSVNLAIKSLPVKHFRAVHRVSREILCSAVHRAPARRGRRPFYRLVSANAHPRVRPSSTTRLPGTRSTGTTPGLRRRRTASSRQMAACHPVRRCIAVNPVLAS